MKRNLLTIFTLALVVGSLAVAACTTASDHAEPETTSAEAVEQTDAFLEQAESAALEAVGIDPATANAAIETIEVAPAASGTSEAALNADGIASGDVRLHGFVTGGDVDDQVRELVEGIEGEVVVTIEEDGSFRVVPVQTETATISTTGLDQPEYPETQTARTLTAQEQLLTGIWTRSINAVVLITTDTTQIRGFFPTPDAATGAGFFWDNEGHVVTNAHVIQSTLVGVDWADDITVTTHSGVEYEVELVGADEFADLAVLKIVEPVPDDSHTLVLGDSSALTPGMTAIALGHPFGTGQDFSMTHGIVSGLNREIQTTGDPTLLVPGVIQTDADVNPGNSGGPLLNSAGRIIGVNTQIRSRDNTNSGVGFALPVNLVKKVVDGIIENGAALHSYIGISMAPLTDRIVERSGVSSELEGIYITVVYEGTPAHTAGLIGDSGYATTGFRATDLEGDGDVILSVNDIPVAEIPALRQFLTFESSPGDVVTFEVLRDGVKVDVPVTLGSRANYE